MIGKKIKEFKDDIYGVNYEAKIENGIFSINLNHKSTDDLLAEFHLYDNLNLIEKVRYSNVLHAQFKLTDYGNYKIRVFIKKDLDTPPEYSFITEAIIYNERTFYKFFNHKKENYEESLATIDKINEKEKKRKESTDLVIERIRAISAFNSSIIDYFKEENIDKISIYSEPGESELAKILWINQRFSAKFEIKLFLSNQAFEYNVRIPKGLKIRHQVLTDNIKFTKEDVILVCTSSKNYDLINQLTKLTGAKIIHLLDIINQLFYKKYIIEPLIKIKDDNPGVDLMVCGLPTVKLIKNKSEHEMNIERNTTSLKDINSMLNSNPPVVPEALKRLKKPLEYSKDTTKIFYRENKSGVFMPENMTSKYVNVVGNFRVTTDQPSKYKNTIYLFGNSVVFGLGSEDCETIASNLQRIVNEHSDQYIVMNCSNHGGSDFDQSFELMRNLYYQKGDIIVSFLNLNITSLTRKYLPTCDVKTHFNRPHDMGEVFIDITHINSIGNKKIAEVLYNSLKSDLINIEKSTAQMKARNKQASASVITSDNEELNKYLKDLEKYKVDGNKIGAIVMNCNPFTLGHRYLIESSAKKVDHLFIFVVEEDKSYFTFKDRLDLVKKGTSDINNITVIPSGKFIISSLTFSNYFEKEKLKEETIDSSEDVTIFGKYIAPALNIKIRFVGEEPLDNVTNQYNQTLNMLLPKYGVTLKIIRRKESDKQVISASRVREYLETKDFESIKKIVPKTTLDYLIKKYN
jgi:[citrate (pro-3S)-lyase] ligase